MAVFTVGEDITEWANHFGLPPALCLADFWQECQGNVHAVGDGGTSFGPFQLHEGGELGDLTPAQAENLNIACSIALGHFAAVKAIEPGLVGGALAAAAQRPADPQVYADEVNTLMLEIGTGRPPVGYLASINAAADVPVPFPVKPPPPLPVPKGHATVAQVAAARLVEMLNPKMAHTAVMNGWSLWYYVDGHHPNPFVAQVAGKPTGPTLYAHVGWNTRRPHA